MERKTLETISAAYTVYTLLNPADRIVISIDSFADAFRVNLAALENMQTVAEDGLPTGDKEKGLSLEKAEDTLQKGFGEAEATLDDKEKLSFMLDKVKRKMASLPMVGNVLANVPTLFKLLNSYLKGEYTETPRKQLIIIVSALSYLVAPIDLIPDFIPIVGLMDDIAVLSVCIKSAQGALEEYLAWREEQQQG